MEQIGANGREKAQLGANGSEWEQTFQVFQRHQAKKLAIFRAFYTMGNEISNALIPHKWVITRQTPEWYSYVNDAAAYSRT
ncbi:MAG: hypothetical protein H7Y86_21665 [Rhizobacter sp.]|nr:hypothetical protein [Ferruginibacter sp.]